MNEYNHQSFYSDRSFEQRFGSPALHGSGSGEDSDLEDQARPESLPRSPAAGGGRALASQRQGRRKKQASQGSASAAEKRKEERNRWQPWQDRLLAKQTLAERPFDCERGETSDRWKKVGEILSGVQGFPARSGPSCKQRMELLVSRCNAHTLRELQSTGEEHEVTSFLLEMEELTDLSNSQSLNQSIAAAAFAKRKRREEEGKRMRDAAMRGLIGPDGETTHRKRQRSQKDRPEISQDEDESQAALQALIEDARQMKQKAEEAEQVQRVQLQVLLDIRNSLQKIETSSQPLVNTGVGASAAVRFNASRSAAMEERHVEVERTASRPKRMRFDPVYNLDC